jgi:hypothetical protein
LSLVAFFIVNGHTAFNVAFQMRDLVVQQPDHALVHFAAARDILDHLGRVARLFQWLLVHQTFFARLVNYHMPVAHT